MPSFNQLKKEFGTKPKEPLHLPKLKAFCSNCLVQTGTKIYFLQQGYGNGCDRCGQFRKGKRFLSKIEFSELTKPEREGAEVKYVEKQTRV